MALLTSFRDVVFSASTVAPHKVSAPPWISDGVLKLNLYVAVGRFPGSFCQTRRLKAVQLDPDFPGSARQPRSVCASNSRPANSFHTSVLRLMRCRSRA